MIQGGRNVEHLQSLCILLALKQDHRQVDRGVEDRALTTGHGGAERARRPVDIEQPSIEQSEAVVRLRVARVEAYRPLEVLDGSNWLVGVRVIGVIKVVHSAEVEGLVPTIEVQARQPREPPRIEQPCGRQEHPCPEETPAVSWWGLQPASVGRRRRLATPRD